MPETNERTEIIKFSQSLHLPGTETVRVETSRRLWRAYHESYNVCALVDSAGMDWRRGRERNHAAGGDVLLAQPGDLTLVTALAQPHTFVAISIPGPILEEAARERGIRPMPPSWRAAQVRNPWLCSEIVHRHAALERLESSLQARSALSDCLHLLFEHCIERRARPPAASPRPNLLRVREYLQENYQQQLGMDAVASAAGMSRYHLSRSFAAEFGLTPHAYLVQVRLAKAKTQLSNGLPVQRVATECGFSDQSHFTRHFRSAFGATPVQYVRAVRKAP